MEVKSVFIIKDGVHNCVDENMFEKVYKPAGWKLCDNHYNEVVEADTKMVDTTKPEAVEEVKNITAMNKKKRTNNKFNDNLIKQ